MTSRLSAATTALLVAAAVTLATFAITSAKANQVAAPPNPVKVDISATFPSGDEGRLIKYGHDIITHTPALMRDDITAQMSCEACHNNAGRKPHAGSLLGIYTQFPEYNKRARRYITLQDRIAECFLYSMNGKPPAYESRAMVALTAYITFISRGATVPNGFRDQGFIPVKPTRAPSVALGAPVYAQRCSMCHAVDGGGNNGAFPPLWGPKSFNNGAGMHRLSTMAAFVRYNMPYGSPPNTLTAQQAYDVSAFVLSHKRPTFAKDRIVTFPAKPARFF